MTTRQTLERLLRERILILDGAMGTSLHAADLDLELVDVPDVRGGHVVVIVIVPATDLVPVRVVGHELDLEVRAAVGNDEVRVPGRDLEHVLLNIPSVAGWPRHRDWISTRTLPDRWGMIGWFQWPGEIAPGTDFEALASQLLDISDPLLVFKLPAAIVEHCFAVDIEELDIESVSVDFSGDLVSNPIPDEIQNGPAYVRDLAKMMLHGVPWYEWSIYNTDLDWTIRLFMGDIARLPEFQLT